MADWNIPASNRTLEEIIVDGGYYDITGTWNSIIQKNGKIYRGRVETFVFDGDKVYFRKIPNSKTHGYEIPGGSMDKYLSNPQQAKVEVQEEAQITCKNVKFTGVTYIEERERPEVAEEGRMYWDGSYNEVYLAEYDGKFTGETDPRNIDTRFIKYGKFYPVEELLKIIRDEHKPIFEQYLDMKKYGLVKEEAEEIPAPEDAPSEKLKSEDKSIPGEWVAQVRHYYDKYQNTHDIRDRQMLLNLGLDQNIMHIDTVIKNYIFARNLDSTNLMHNNPDSVTYESDDSILADTEQSEPLPVSSDWYNNVLNLYSQYKSTNAEQFKSE